MRNFAVISLVLVVVAVLLLYLVSFQVSQSESALVMTFGKPTREIVEPGWKWKWPSPIQTLVKYDSRQRFLQGIAEETTTKGGEPIIVTTYMIWQVDKPGKFKEAVGDAAGAEKLLRSLLRDSQNKIIGQHYFGEFVNTDKSKIKFEQIEEQMHETVAGAALASYGVNVKAVGIKQLGVSQKVTEDVFGRMRADRRRKTEAILAQGNAEATKIRTDAESKKTELLAAAQARAKAIRGQGDAEAAKYYKMLEDDPEFAMFLRKIEALKNILRQRSTVVLPADVEPFELLKKMPEIEPEK